MPCPTTHASARASALASTLAIPLLLASGLAAAPTAQAACAEGLRAPSPASAKPDTRKEPGSQSDDDAASPRLALLSLLESAQQRSKAVGAAKLLADAAEGDAEGARSAGQPQLSFNTSALPINGQSGSGQGNQFQLRPTFTLSAPLYDAGRNDFMARWREHLAEASHHGQINTQEQLALQTVSLSLDRSRYRLQSQVWSQYAHKVCGLVDSLEQIVAADRGRGSELAQARKTLQQVLLSRAQALTQLRLTETRLRRLVGEPLPELPAGLATLLLQAPELTELQSQAADSPSIAQLAAQANAAQAQAQATEAGQQPQANWQLSAGKNLTGDKAGYWNAGLTLSVPLLNPAAKPTARSANQRAEAARLQRADALEALQFRLAEVHEQALATMQRTRDVVEVLKISERVREDTLLQWQQLGKRSLFDVMSAEGDHFNLRLAYVDALHDGQQSVALLWSLASGVATPLR